jgi:membrane-bound inhibitor of C-type lysozyme
MKPDTRFLKQKKDFWANVRTISQEVGYIDSKAKRILVPSLPQIRRAMEDLGLESNHIMDAADKTTPFGTLLTDYFAYRAHVLSTEAEPNLMNVTEAKEAFETLRDQLKPTCPLPMNKQTGEKKSQAYLTCIVNMLVEANAQGFGCDYNPLSLTTVTRRKKPLRTLARRVDGAFLNTVNPIAVWEIKEYYFTTTFGSRVADGVYETLLDGLELEELRVEEQIDVKHYLMIDAHYTWWTKGKSYLCRIVDMLHMGYVDEVLFGREVITRLPELVAEWVEIARQPARRPGD